MPRSVAYKIATKGEGTSPHSRLSNTGFWPSKRDSRRSRAATGHLYKLHRHAVGADLTLGRTAHQLGVTPATDEIDAALEQE